MIAFSGVAYNHSYNKKEGGTVTNALIIIGVVVFWVVLQKYILPRMGFDT